MNAAQIADQAIAKIEAEENGVIPPDDGKNKGGEDPKGGKDASKEEPKDSKNADDSKPKSGEGDDAAGGKGTDDKKDSKKEGEFTADDAVEIEEPKPNNQPTDSAGTVLSQAEQQYIVDNIGEPLVIRGVRGSGDDAKEVEIKAYSPADIPNDFRFANDQQMLAAQTGFQNLEKKANDLLGSYRQNQSQKQAQEFEHRENEGIKADIADLQKEGRFPKFTVRPGADGFDDTPEAKQMIEVLAVMTERNEMYMKQYQQGRPYKHIGFAEAFDIWEAKSPELKAAKKADDDQIKEDAERKKAAEHGQSNRGMNVPKVVKPTVRPGTTVNDILNKYDNDDTF